MDIGLFAPLVSPTADREYLTTLGLAAEAHGFHSIWFGEHVVVFDNDRSRYPWSSDGRMPNISGSRGLPEMFTTMAFLAAQTERIRLGTGIAILPIRHPVLTAKEAANVDWLSGGRLDLGVGLGWSESEYDAMGVPWRRRGERMDAYLDLVKRLWRDEITEYESEFYRLEPCRMDPKPVQPQGVPLFIAGHARRTLQRVAEYGDGWYALALEPADVAEALSALEPMLHERGRSLDDITVVVNPYTRPVRPEDVPAYRDAGVKRLLTTVIATDAAQLERRIERASTLVRAA